MMKLSLDSLRHCLEGIIPSTIATCSTSGIPNVTYVSQVHYVDEQHVALSFQFFNKTRENILSNPYAMVQLVAPDNGAHYRLELRYLRTETEGALFEHMKTRLAGIASHTGMSKVFRLLGADIYQVLSITNASPDLCTHHMPGYNRLAALNRVSKHLSQCCDLNSLMEQTLLGLRNEFKTDYAMILMYDRSRHCLYTVASTGYSNSGVGAEIPLGAGIIGTAANERTPIRINHMTGEFSYSLAVRESMNKSGNPFEFETEIPFPGLATPHSQIAVPMMLHNSLSGILYLESEEDMRFNHEDEDSLTILGAQLAALFELFERNEEASSQLQPPNAEPAIVVQGEKAQIRYFTANQSIFIDDEYLIKGVAGAILWKLLCDYHQFGRNTFSNRELRLDTSLGLPDICDNLEARLVLLQKRLQEKCDYICIEKAGRGRFTLVVKRPLSLLQIN